MKGMLMKLKSGVGLTLTPEGQILLEAEPRSWTNVGTIYNGYLNMVADRVTAKGNYLVPRCVIVNAKKLGIKNLRLEIHKVDLTHSGWMREVGYKLISIWRLEELLAERNVIEDTVYGKCLYIKPTD